jgi:predicted phosphodiesterase
LRFLLISDIHSNLEALEACLGHAPSCDHIVNLGDVVGYGGSPNEVVARARALGGTVIRGNHDKVCAGLQDMRDFNPIAGMAAIWTRQQLTPENLAWVKSLPAGPLDLPVSRPAGADVPRLVHGSPLGEDEYIIVPQEAEQPLIQSPVPLTFFGHTHIQGGFSVREEILEVLRPGPGNPKKSQHSVLKLEGGTKYLINPGSVGQPRDGDRRAAFAVFDDQNYTVSFHRVPYNVEAAQRHIFDAHLPERLATRLAEGR